MTNDGMSFLKCAFASPDFNIDPGKGIPDRYNGRTVSIKDCHTTSLAFAPNKDTYICILPVPGYAYFKAEVDIGSDPTTLAGYSFPTYPTNFGTNSQASKDLVPLMSVNNFTKFRYASLACGLYPTSNQMQFAGAVSLWKANINLQRRLGEVVIGPALTDTSRNGTFSYVSGTNSIKNLIPRDNYTESFIKGVYALSSDSTGDFEWSDFEYAGAYLDPDNGFFEVDSGSLERPLTGLGNMEALIIKVTTPTGAVNTAALKTWNCMELQVSTSSGLYQFSHASPSYDPIALNAYMSIRNELPVAVPCAMNAQFWARVLNILRGLTNMATHIPGPVGLIATGVHQLIS